MINCERFAVCITVIAKSDIGKGRKNPAKVRISRARDEADTEAKMVLLKFER